MSRRYRRWPSASYAVFAILALLVALRAGWDFVDSGPDDNRSSDVISGDVISVGTDSLRAGPCQVVRVVDGDTLIVRQDAPEPRYRVRLLGVDTPETVKEGTAVQAWGPEATEFAREFVRRGKVTLELDKRRVDRFGRSLAYVYVEDEMLNVELVRAGLARVSHYPGDSMAMLRLLRQAETEARQAGRGIWSTKDPPSVRSGG